MLKYFPNYQQYMKDVQMLLLSPSWSQIGCHILTGQCPKQEGRGWQAFLNFFSFYQAGTSFPEAPTSADRLPLRFHQPKHIHYLTYSSLREDHAITISGKRKQDSMIGLGQRDTNSLIGKSLISNLQSQEPNLPLLGSLISQFLACFHMVLLLS